MTIGVFDSGLGAHLVAERLHILFPELAFRIATDEENVPYGDRSEQEIISLVDAALQPLLGECQIIILACNTATAVAIDWLRRSYPNHQFIGFEPMIKPAAELTTSGVVTVLATAATRQSARYKRLIATYAPEVTILEPNTERWASLIQNGEANTIDLTEVINSVDKHESDIIALACTHYLALEIRLREALPTETIIEPTPAVAEQLKRLLLQSQPR